MDSDYLVIGSGIAGLSFALRVAEFGSVVVITKKGEVDTATNLAQGGIAAVLDEDDCFEEHIEDTLVSGAGLCNKEVVKMVVENGPDRVRDLVKEGVSFVKSSSDQTKFDLGKEGGHSRRRVAHSYDLTGREIERALAKKANEHQGITILEGHVAVDLLMADRDSKKKKCVGAYVLSPENEVKPYRAKMTLLCTGGCGKVYLYTSNPDIATGDGVAMAARSGAVVANMEFVQFHPTCLYHPKAKNFLISEAVRGEGGILVDVNGNPFMHKYDDRKDLATRDAVARAIDSEMKKTGEDNVYLDITHRSHNFLQKRFPTIYSRCFEYGIDISREPIPVVPAAHYMCGGVLVDEWGRSTVNGLMCLGETSCTGLHGGNRLASNSLLEAVVYAKKAADWCENENDAMKKLSHPEVDEWSAGVAEPLDEEILINHNWDQIRRLMWNYVGIVRSDRRLQLAEEKMSQIREEIERHYRNYFVTTNMIELRNLCMIGQMIINSAKYRKESRGLHYSKDYPEKSQDFKHWLALKKGNCPGEWGIKKIDISLNT